MGELCDETKVYASGETTLLEIRKEQGVTCRADVKRLSHDAALAVIRILLHCGLSMHPEFKTQQMDISRVENLPAEELHKRLIDYLEIPEEVVSTYQSKKRSTSEQSADVAVKRMKRNF